MNIRSAASFVNKLLRLFWFCKWPTNDKKRPKQKSALDWCRPTGVPWIWIFLVGRVVNCNKRQILFLQLIGQAIRKSFWWWKALSCNETGIGCSSGDWYKIKYLVDSTLLWEGTALPAEMIRRAIGLLKDDYRAPNQTLWFPNPNPTRGRESSVNDGPNARNLSTEL